VLDPVADKTWLGFLGLFLVLPWRENPLPIGFLALVLVRDATIIIGAYFAYRESGVVMKSNMLGKLAMGAVAITLISYTVNWPPATTSPYVNPRTLMYLTSLILLLSGLNYSFRLRAMLRAVRAGKTPPDTIS
jgi:phosphatidylglycerophosphate synthase